VRSVHPLLFLVFSSFLPLAAGCYSRPRVPPDKPLSCAQTDAAGECPSGFACLKGVCASATCAVDTDCPAGLACNPGRGCLIPGTEPVPVPPGGVIPVDGGVFPFPDAAFVDLGVSGIPDAGGSQ
jgi:hypothetical protein